VAEFKFFSLFFVFIVPFSLEDEKDFLNAQDYQTFWSLFEHYNRIGSWAFQDLSSCESVEFGHKVQFNTIDKKSK